MKRLSNSTSLARDRLDALSLKVVTPYIYKPLCHIINLSI